MGNILSKVQVKKGEALYLHGVPNSGKSVLIEQFLIDLYGVENIGIINFSDRKYFLEQCKNKKLIIINEYKHNIHLREIMLKILDNSLIDLNQKYKSSEKISLINTHKTIMSNFSPMDQEFDDALNKRIIPVNLSQDFQQLNISYEKLVNSFCILPIIFSISMLYMEKCNDKLNTLRTFIPNMYAFFNEKQKTEFLFFHISDIYKISDPIIKKTVLYLPIKN